MSDSKRGDSRAWVRTIAAISLEPMTLGRVVVLLVAMAWCAPVSAQSPTSEPPAAQQSDTNDAPSPWLIVPVFSSSPKLGTAFGGLGAFLHTFDPASRVSLFGIMYEYTSTHSQIASVFARTSLGADHHRIVTIVALGHIKNDYDDYLGTGQPLRTDADMRAVAARYLFRTKNNWFIGAQGNAANYQVMGATPEDDLVLETLGVRGFQSAALGAAVMHDSRDNEDMPTKGWFLNMNNLAYREALAGLRHTTRIVPTSRSSWSTAEDTSSRYGSSIGSPATRPPPRRRRSFFAATSSVSTSRRTCRRSRRKNVYHSARDGVPRCLQARPSCTARRPWRSLAPHIRRSERDCIS